MRYAGVFMLLLFLGFAALYLVSFGVACTFISTRTTRPWLRRSLDTVAALVSLYVTVQLWLRFAPLINNPALACLTFPCVGGVFFGILYATMRRYSLP